MASAGVGYAALSSTVTLKGSAAAENPLLTVVSIVFATDSPPVTLTNGPLPSEFATTTFSDVAAGDSFGVNITVMNAGTGNTRLTAESFSLGSSRVACIGSSASVTATNGTIGQVFAPDQGFYTVVGIQVPELTACTTGSLYLILAISITGVGV